MSLKKGANNVEILYDLSRNFRTWDEFSPNLYTLDARLETKDGNDIVKESFGVRELGIKGSQITVNGNSVFSGELLNAVFFQRLVFLLQMKQNGNALWRFVRLMALIISVFIHGVLLKQHSVWQTSLEYIFT